MSCTVTERRGMRGQEVTGTVGRDPTRTQELTREPVVKNLRRLGVELGRCPEKRDAIKHVRYSERSYTRKFPPFSELVSDAES